MTQHLAQLNIGRLTAPTDDPKVADFMGALDRVNGMGKRMPGFVWMMQGSGEPGTGNTENNIGDDPQFVANLTVWEDAESLQNFAFNTVHRQFYERRAEWFEKPADISFVMWHIPAGHVPTLEEGMERLQDLRDNGATERAFNWAYLVKKGLPDHNACASEAAE